MKKYNINNLLLQNFKSDLKQTGGVECTYTDWQKEVEGVCRPELCKVSGIPDYISHDDTYN